MNKEKKGESASLTVQKSYDFKGPAAQIILADYKETFATKDQKRTTKAIFFNGKGYQLAIGKPIVVERAMADTLYTNGELLAEPVYLN